MRNAHDGNSVTAERDWEECEHELRRPMEVATLWQGASARDLRLLAHETRGDWWDALRQCNVTLLVSREYEHLLVALRAGRRGGDVTFQRLPHPSGLAFDERRGIVHVACTRNPNQIFDLRPVASLSPPRNSPRVRGPQRPLLPTRIRLLPGCLYTHDLAMIGGKLHANAVGQNCVVTLDEEGGYRPVWWPRCVEVADAPCMDRNYLQLNSIAAGRSLSASYFTASTDAIGKYRPGHLKFAVEGRGVLFSGRAREVVARGLTRPHSARLHRGRVWLANSGYGEVGCVDDGKFHAVARLPGWTRGLCFVDDVMFVGTSRIIPRFRHYAPGLNVAASVCGVHALHVPTGRTLGSLLWPNGYQIFGVQALPATFTDGLPQPLAGDGLSTAAEAKLFYAFRARARTRSESHLDVR